MANANVAVPEKNELLDPVNESGLVGELLGTCEHIVGGIISGYPNDGESMHDLLSLLAVIEKCITIQERSEAGFDQALSKMRASGTVASKPEQAPAQDDTDIRRDLEMGVMLLHAALVHVRDRWTTQTADMDERTNTLLMMLMATLERAGSKIDRTTGCFEDWH